MRLGALKGFQHISCSNSAATKAPLCLHPLKLLETITPSVRPDARLRRWSRTHQFRFASINKQQLLEANYSKGLKAVLQIQQEDGEHDVVRGPEKRKPEAWVAVLDQYLPQSLRDNLQRSRLGLESADPLAIENVPTVLANARRACKVDLLGYIGVFQERWEAVYWLVNQMLAKCPPFYVLKNRTERLPTVLWDTIDYGLDEITNHHVDVTNPKRSKLRLESFIGHDPLGSHPIAVTGPRQILGELWQSIGSMLLQIEDRSSDNPNRAVIMIHVLDIFAHMHHKDVLPDSIYNYKLTREKSVLQRPPTLYLLSARILSTLSDISWKSYWAHEMEKAETQGYELFPPRVEPQMPRVGVEVWLELVLWACVEGGWISEAAWLVSEIQRRRSNPKLQWSVISWDEMSSRKKPKLGLIAGLKREIDKSRLNQATGIAIASGGTSNFDLDMGTRTISREVVLAIADGLANSVTDKSLSGNTLAQVQNHILSCQGLLERGELDKDAGYSNRLILRKMESSVIDPKLQPGYLQMLLALAPNKPTSRSPSLPQGSHVGSNKLDFSASVLGLLHRLLNSYARQANLKGSLQALRSMQEIVDGNRDSHIQEFAHDLQGRPLQGTEIQGTDSFVPIETKQRQTPPILYPDMPAHVVEALFDLIVESKAFEVGQWILSNEDIDGGILNPKSFGDASLQPALLRFATATASDELLMKVLENVEPPLSEPILHALLRCQVAVNRWDGVESILNHFKATIGMAWTPVDVMTIAAALPALEWKCETQGMGHLLQAKGILQALVQGEFNNPQNKARTPDLQQMRMANQLGRVFQGLPGALSTMKLGPKGRLGRAHYSVAIPSDAFHILLESIVWIHGPLAGIKLWEQWCQDPMQSDPSKRESFVSTDIGGLERVVQPTVSMLRLILKPATEELKDTLYSNDEKAASRMPLHEDLGLDLRQSLAISGDSLSVFDWCIKMYKKFGFSDGEINSEIPPNFERIIAGK